MHGTGFVAEVWDDVARELASDYTVYALDATPTSAGQFDTEVRIHPAHALLSHPLEMGLLKRL